ETKVDAAEDSRVADIVGDLVEPGVAERHPRHGRVRHGDGMATLTEGTLQNLGGAVAGAAVIRRIARETRRENVRHIGDVTVGSGVAIQVTLENRRLGPPELVVIFRPE